MIIVGMFFFLSESLAYSCFCQLMKRMSCNFPPHGGAMDTHFANMRSLIQVRSCEKLKMEMKEKRYCLKIGHKLKNSSRTLIKTHIKFLTKTFRLKNFAFILPVSCSLKFKVFYKICLNFVLFFSFGIFVLSFL